VSQLYKIDPHNYRDMYQTKQDDQEYKSR
jgi:hypothetical protein